MHQVQLYSADYPSDIIKGHHHNTIHVTTTSIIPDHIYLDHAGAALYPECAVKRYQDDLLSNLYGNTHSVGSGSSSKTQEVVGHVRFM